MKRNQLIIIAIAAFIGLWMFSQSGKASTTSCDGIYTSEISSDTSIDHLAPMQIKVKR